MERVGESRGGRGGGKVAGLWEKKQGAGFMTRPISPKKLENAPQMEPKRFQNCYSSKQVEIRNNDFSSLHIEIKKLDEPPSVDNLMTET